jgi:hypothetical protein
LNKGNYPKRFPHFSNAKLSKLPPAKNDLLDEHLASRTKVIGVGLVYLNEVRFALIKITFSIYIGKRKWKK